MGLWHLKKINSALEALKMVDGRERNHIASWLWEEVMGFTSKEEKNLSALQEEKLSDALSRLTHGEPVQYIAGHAWFYGLKLKVTPDVLIPRPETEELVHWLIEDLHTIRGPRIKILDVGTGSGCIAVALKKELGDRIEMTALDISASALKVAKENADLHHLDIQFIHFDFLEMNNAEAGRFDIIISNPPYISKKIIEQNLIDSLRHEPSLALYAPGDDPDIFYQHVSSKGRELLTPGGICYVEMNEFRFEVIQSFFIMHGWQQIETKKDLQGAMRLLKAKAPG